MEVLLRHLGLVGSLGALGALAKLAPAIAARMAAFMATSRAKAGESELGRFFRRTDELTEELGIPRWFVDDYVKVGAAVVDGSSVFATWIFLEVLFPAPVGARRFADPDKAMRLVAERIQMMTRARGGAPRSDEQLNRLAREIEAWRASVKAASSPASKPAADKRSAQAL